MRHFSSGDNFLEMEVPLVEGASVHSVNGAAVVLRVRSNGYSGVNDLWVHAPDLKAFACRRVLRTPCQVSSRARHRLSALARHRCW